MYILVHMCLNFLVITCGHRKRRTSSSAPDCTLNELVNSRWSAALAWLLIRLYISDAMLPSCARGTARRGYAPLSLQRACLCSWARGL